MELEGGARLEADDRGSSAAEPSQRVLVIGGKPQERNIAVERLRATGIFEVAERDGAEGASDAAAIPAGFWGILSFAGAQTYSRSHLAGSPQLRALAVVDASPDGIDVGAATELGIAVCVAPGRTVDAIADHTLALILACMRQVLHVDEVVRAGRWRPDGLASDLHGATVGVVGRGASAEAVIRRLLAFECRVLVSGPEGETGAGAVSSPHYECVSLRDLLPRVDVLTLHVEPWVAAKPLVGVSELAALRPEAVLVNTADPRLVHHGAVAEALARGRLAGVALDALPTEPQKQLLRASNTVLTGGVASLTDGVIRSRIHESVGSLAAFSSLGQAPRCVNPEAIRLGKPVAS